MDQEQYYSVSNNQEIKNEIESLYQYYSSDNYIPSELEKNINKNNIMQNHISNMHNIIFKYLIEIKQLDNNDILHKNTILSNTKMLLALKNEINSYSQNND